MGSNPSHHEARAPVPLAVAPQRDSMAAASAGGEGGGEGGGGEGGGEGGGDGGGEGGGEGGRDGGAWAYEPEKWSTSTPVASDSRLVSPP